MNKKLKCAAVIILITCSISKISAQIQGDSLVSTQVPLDIGLQISIKEVRNSKLDSVHLPHQLYYRNSAETYDSIKVRLKSRGNFRLEQCYFPPLWIKLHKNTIRGTVFEGNKKLKLVLSCNYNKGSNALIAKELLCYKLYEVISPYFFKTRMVNIDFTELRGEKEKHFQLKGILIEDLKKTAKRFHAKSLENAKLHSTPLQDTGALRFFFFQFMISNTDLSTAYQHNAKLIQLHKGSYFSIPYDFDMSGVVDAPYAVVSQIGDQPLGNQSVRERLYRGWCQSPQVTEFVRNEFLLKKAMFMAKVDDLKEELSGEEIKDIKDYLEDFFEILKKDDLFKRDILEACRSTE